MKLEFLGTGSSYPTPHRGVSSLLLHRDCGSVWLFDVGEGTQIQLQKVSVSRRKISRIFITHLHGDHLFGLPGMMCTLSSQMAVSDPDPSTKDSHVIDIYGPLGLRKYLLTSLALSRSPLSFCFRIHEMEPVISQYPDDWNNWRVDHVSDANVSHPNELESRVIKPSGEESDTVKWTLIEDECCVVEAGFIHHRVPSFAFVIKGKTRPGTLLVDKLREMDIKPGPIYGMLKSGISVTLDDGRIVDPTDVLGPPILGRTIVICGDTSDASPILHLVSDCDLLVHEATHDNTLHEKAKMFGHSTPSQAAEFALKIKAKVLILNHFSRRYADSGWSDKWEETVDYLLNQAKETLKGSPIRVLCAYDFSTYEISTKNT